MPNVSQHTQLETGRLRWIRVSLPTCLSWRWPQCWAVYYSTAHAEGKV